MAENKEGEEGKVGDEFQIVLAQRLIIAPSGGDPGAIDDGFNGTFIGSSAVPGDPAAIAVGGGWLYVDSLGNLKYKGPQGTVTTLGAP